MPYRDRAEAGRLLAQHVAYLRDEPDLVVLGLPRGGVPVAFEVAKALRAPMDVFVVRKLGVPGHEELALGAVASGGDPVLNAGLVGDIGISDDAIAALIQSERHEIERQERLYGRKRVDAPIKEKTVVVVDDGLATGATMRAAVQAVRDRNPRRVIVAVPVASPSTCSELEDEADEVVCPATPEPFRAVGKWYEDFDQVSDDKVRELLGSFGA